MPRVECGIITPDGKHTTDGLIAVGPTILANVSQPIVDGVPDTKNKSTLFLVDSGASHSCIDAALATELALPVIDRIQIGGVAGAHEHDVVLAQLTIPSIGFVMSGRFAAVHLTAGGQPHEALFGRDFLKHVVMIYDGMHGRVSILK